MTNLITSNASTFEMCVYHLVGLISSPFQIAICTYLLYKYIGLAIFAGLSTIVIFFPLNGFFVNLSKKMRKTKYEIQDSRIKMINEILNGIRVIKFYGWEESFQRIVKKLRNKEISHLIKTSLLTATSSFTWSCAPYVVSSVSFLTFLIINKNVNSLTDNFIKL